MGEYISYRIKSSPGPLSVNTIQYVITFTSNGAMYSPRYRPVNTCPIGGEYNHVFTSKAPGN